MKPLRHPLMPIGPGHRTPRTLLTIDERDALLIEIAHRFFGGLSDREAARRIHHAISLYRDGRWRRTAIDLQSPHPADRIETLLWSILRVRDRLPSARLIRLVIARAR